MQVGAPVNGTHGVMVGEQAGAGQGGPVTGGEHGRCGGRGDAQPADRGAAPEQGDCRGVVAEDTAVELLPGGVEVVGDDRVVRAGDGDAGLVRPDPDLFAVEARRQADDDRSVGVAGRAERGQQAAVVAGAVQCHGDRPGCGAGERLRSGVPGDLVAHPARRVGGVRVGELGREGLSSAVDPAGDGAEQVASLGQGGGAVLDHERVVDVVEDGVLDEHPGVVAAHRPVLGEVLQVVVEQVRGRGVVQAPVALHGVADPVVVRGQLGDDVARPADAEGLVDVADDVPGQCHVVAVLADVDAAVADALDAGVVDPDVVGGVEADAVVVVVTALAVEVAGDVRVPDGQVPDDHVVAAVEEQAAADELGARSGADDGLVRAHGDHVAERVHGDAARDLDGQRLGRDGVLAQLLQVRHPHGGAVGAAGGGVPVGAGHRGEADRVCAPGALIGAGGRGETGGPFAPGAPIGDGVGGCRQRDGDGGHQDGESGEHVSSVAERPVTSNRSKSA